MTDWCELHPGPICILLAPHPDAFDGLSCPQAPHNRVFDIRLHAATTGNCLTLKTWGEAGETEGGDSWGQGKAPGSIKETSLSDIGFSSQLTQGLVKSDLGTGQLLAVSPVICLRITGRQREACMPIDGGTDRENTSQNQGGDSAATMHCSREVSMKSDLIPEDQCKSQDNLRSSWASHFS